MLVAPLDRPAQWRPWISAPILTASLAWLAEHAATATEGTHELGEPGWQAIVQGYPTISEAECVWENHERTVDVQYLLAGREGIRVLPVERLGAPTVVKPETDTQKFAAPAEPGHLVVLEPGDFAVFLPGDAHRPKIAVGAPSTLRKVVIKVPAARLTAG